MANTLYEIASGLKSNYIVENFKSSRMGRVHSVFQNSFNIEFQHKLLHIGCSKNALSAFGAAISHDQMNKVLPLITVKNIVRLKENKLLIYAGSSCIQLDLSSFSEQNLYVEAAAVFNKTANIQACRLILKALKIEEISAVIKTAEDLKQLQALLEEKEPALTFYKEIIAYFWGRGQGLTPSGDDFLLGYTLMAKAYLKQEKWQDAVFMIRQQKSTTAVSEAYYDALLQGYASAQFKKLVDLLQSDIESAAVKDSIYQIMDFGHTSGRDTLLGIYAFLETHI